MQKHTKIYMDYFGYGEQDFIPCEMSSCEKRCVDVHHIVFRSHGGKDEIENLIGLCRSCHNLAHDGTLSKRDLMLVHKRFMGRPTTGAMGKAI